MAVSVSRSLLWCTCTDLAFWMIAGWTGSGSGGCCPWWSLWPSCDIGWCRCPGGQVVCPWRCVVQTSLASGEPYGCGRSKVWGFYCDFFTTLSVWVDHFSLSVMCTPRNLTLSTLNDEFRGYYGVKCWAVVDEQHSYIGSHVLLCITFAQQYHADTHSGNPIQEHCTV